MWLSTVCLCPCVHSYLSLGRPEKDIGNPACSNTTLFSWGRVSHWAGSWYTLPRHAPPAGQQASKPWWSFPRLDFQGSATPSFYADAGNLMLAQQHGKQFYSLKQVPGPQKNYLSLSFLLRLFVRNEWTFTENTITLNIERHHYNYKKLIKVNYIIIWNTMPNKWKFKYSLWSLRQSKTPVGLAW